MEKSREAREQFHQRLKCQVQALFQIDDYSGVEVFSALQRIVQIIDMLEMRQPEEGQPISGARWRLLLHLFLAEQVGHSAGVTPTELSRFQQVSKNTTSALLRGLEEQGYIVREMDPRDLRVFRISLSPAGRQVVLDTAPHRFQALNQFLAGMTRAEVSQLIALLTKLRHTLEDAACPAQPAEPEPAQTSA